MAAPSSPTPRCWAPPWRAWLAGIASSPTVARRGLGADGCQLWRVWMIAALAMLAVLAQKLHHEYYFLILAPAAAAGVGHALDRLAAFRGTWALAAAVGLVLLCGLQARSTWR